VRILHTMLRVGDLEKSLAFYTEALGLKFPTSAVGLLLVPSIGAMNIHHFTHR